MIQVTIAMKYKIFLMCVLISIPFLAQAVDGPAAHEPGDSEISISTIAADDYQILFIGNSHSAFNDLPGLVSRLLITGLPGASANASLAPGFGFLDDRLHDGVTQQRLNSQQWSHVILQAQKYSSSGLYWYSTAAAEEWIRRVKSRGALPVLFPEWPRRGNREEGPRVHLLHLGIAAAEPACVAPIGLAWEESIARHPTLALHAADGNHSNLNGALLTAFVFYQLISGLPADELPHVQQINVNSETQRKLRDVASFVSEQNQVRCTDVGIQADNDRLEFENEAGANDMSRTLTISSSGVLDLDINSITEPQDPFSIVGGSCSPLPITLAPTESCTVVVQYEPAPVPPFTAILEINSSADSSPTIIELSGFSIAVVVPTLTFGGLVLLSALVLLGAQFRS
jgi:hypothetical protein